MTHKNNTNYTLKEIEEQPKAVRATISKYVHNKDIDLGIPANILLNLKYVYYIGSGTSYNACLVGERLVARYFNHIEVRAVLASEFRLNADQLKTGDSLAICISTSGETRDTVVALSYCKMLGIKTLAITSNKLSSLAYEADYTLFPQTQLEISVASTKSFSCQLALIYLIGIKAKHLKLLHDQNVSETFANSVRDTYLQILRNVLNQMDIIISKTDEIKKIAKVLAKCSNMLLLGGVDLPICKEGALKLKELCNIHAEAIPVGEINHGSIVLVDPSLYSIIISTTSNNSHELTGAAAIKTRGGKLISIISDNTENAMLEKSSDYIIKIPDLHEASLFSASLTVIYLQLLAYYIAVEKNLDPDRPRNLAKSITVE